MKIQIKSENNKRTLLDYVLSQNTFDGFETLDMLVNKLILIYYTKSAAAVWIISLPILKNSVSLNY